MDEKKVMAKLQKMPMEEKLKLLSETDKAFIHGYIERALIEQNRKKDRQTSAGSLAGSPTGKSGSQTRVNAKKRQGDVSK